MATPDEIRRAREQSSIFGNLFDYVRANEAQLASEGRRPVLGGLLSKEPVMGTDTIRYEGLGPMLAGLLEPLARGVDAPRAAAQGLIPQEDMIGEAFGTAGTAMLGGGAVAKPAGALGANTLRVYHGGDYRYGDDINAPFFVTPDRKGAEYFAPDDVPFSSVSNFEADLSNALDIDTLAGQAQLSEILTKYGIEHDYNPDSVYEKIDIYDVPDDVSYDGTNLLDAAYIPEVQDALKKEGVSALYSSADALENSSIPAYAVVDPTILGANASKSSGLLSVASDVSARGDQILNMLKSGRGSEVTDAMLDMGDGVKNTQLNQYLAANYDLPMDEASRLARAREMGFEGGLLHGTGSDITAVDPAKLGGKQNVLGKGFYQTTNPQRSDRYVPKVKDDDGSLIFAEGGNVMPLMTKSADEFDLTVPTGKENITRIANAFEGSDYDVELRDGGDSVFIQSKTDPSASVFLDSYAEGQNTLMRLKDAFGNNNITPILQEAGFTGVKGVESRGSNVRVNYNPQDVRTQFARFDPRLSHLSNVTAANASPISGLLAQSGVSSEQAQRIEDYLYRTGLLQ
jgi:hypothetical protein